MLPMGIAVVGAAIVAGSAGTIDVAGATGTGAAAAGRDGIDTDAPEGLTDGAAGTWAQIIAPRINVDTVMKITPDHGSSPDGLYDKQSR